ncbi:hypothetical protein MPSEU_000917200 [Mayamaea pseudoterrestris]|nr:hypothetical protein MPSEU_000917200 [Mayamaea pseudoterrestris]
MEDLLDSPNPPGRKLVSSSFDDHDEVQDAFASVAALTPQQFAPSRTFSVASTRSDDEDDDDFDDDASTPKDLSKCTLKQLASLACKRIEIGTAVMPKPLFEPDPEDYNGSEELRDAAFSTKSTYYARILEQEFNAVVVEHHCKWAPLCVSEPGPLVGGTPSERLGRYDFHHSDSIVDWALERNMSVKGHVLVWAASSPVNLLKAMEPNQVAKVLKEHIFTVMGHYRGRIVVWDVVNEPLAPDGTLAENVFFQKLGSEYVEMAFRWAHEADPNATLILNENKAEGIGTAKADAFYELCADLKAKGVPFHGVGLQAHFNAAGTGRHRPPTPRMVKQQIRRLGKLGLSVNISEMDVRVSQLPAELREQAQKQVYHDIIAAALSEPACSSIWLWGFSDRHSWVHNFYYDDEPLIFDESFARKESYFGVRDALLSLVPSGTVGGRGNVLLDSDFDADGNPWGHAWYQPEPEGIISDSIGGQAGDSRPDWEQE